MKYIFSDYDGTIKRFTGSPDFVDQIFLNYDRKAIDDFIKSGNKFIVITGRSTDSILNSISKYNINYDYIISYDGRVCIDKNNNVIYAKYLDKSVIDIVERNKLGKISSICGVFGNSTDYNDMIYLIVDTNIKKIDDLKKYYPNIEFTYYRLLGKLILSFPFDKKMAIDELRKKYNLDSSNIYTIGDGKNDKTMLEAYNGYKMLVCYPSLYNMNINTITSVHSLIKKIK